MFSWVAFTLTSALKVLPRSSEYRSQMKPSRGETSHSRPLPSNVAATVIGTLGCLAGLGRLLILESACAQARLAVSHRNPINQPALTFITISSTTHHLD